MDKSNLKESWLDEIGLNEGGSKESAFSENGDKRKKTNSDKGTNAANPALQKAPALQADSALQENTARRPDPALRADPAAPPDQLLAALHLDKQEGVHKGTYASEYGERLVTHVNPKSPVAEAYRILRTNLTFAALDKPFRTLLLTSPGPSEGKSTILANLGIAMAQAGTRTLLVDCDLRKPLLHKLFGLPNWRGFTNLLVEKGAELEKVLQDTPIPNLKVLTSGPLPPNPSELLASRRAVQVLEKAQEKFQLVLIDSPPVVAVTDAAILSAKVDGVLLVIRSHETRINLALQAKNLLDKANAHIIGVVLNGVPIGGDDYYYYYYYGSGAFPGGQGAWQMLRRSLGAAWARLWRRKGDFEEDIDF